ncbi:hypothetical protein C8J56DRAFT_334022 [Mycena floridula]|nr:hypothetical protein C8J56DRAFT_334022 [Mycena floridula]
MIAIAITFLILSNSNFTSLKYMWANPGLSRVRCSLTPLIHHCARRLSRVWSIIPNLFHIETIMCSVTIREGQSINLMFSAEQVSTC